MRTHRRLMQALMAPHPTERRGFIKVIKNGQTLAQPFLDMRTSVALFAGQGNGQGERGLINLALHPDYAKNGRFYVFYTRSAADPYFDGTRREGDIVVAEGHRSSANREVADPALKQIFVVHTMASTAGTDAATDD